MTASAYLPDIGRLIWTDFDPTKGREQAGRRPALVLSPAAFTENTGLAIVCPITSRVRPFPTSVVLPSGLPIAGEILTSHIRSIDTRSAHPLRRRRCAARDRAARSCKAEHVHHDLNGSKPRAPRSRLRRRIETPAHEKGGCR